MSRYYVIKHHKDAHPKDVHHTSSHTEKYTNKGIPYEVFANELMQYEPFVRYLQTYGSHFTPALADHLVSAHKKGKVYMGTQAVKEALSNSHMELPKEVTLGDFTYLVNAKYKGHSDAIAKAFEEISSPPYPGFIFNRWLADHIGMGQSIEWEDFV